MGTIGKVTYDVEANTSTLDTSMATAVRKIQGHSSNISKSLDGIQSAFSLAEKAAALFGIGLGIHEFADFVERTAASAQQLQSLAGTIGVTTTELQGLRIAGDQVGVSQEALQTGLDRLTRSVGEAADGNKTAIKTFNDLGVGVLNANGQIRPTQAILNDVATALSKIQDPARRATAEVTLFGRAGQLLDPLLRQGGAGIDAMTEAAQNAGSVIDTETIQSLARLNGKIDETNQAWRAAGAEWVQAIQPAIDKVLELSRDAANMSHGLASGITFGRAVESGQPGTADQLAEARKNLDGYRAEVARLQEAEKTEGMFAIELGRLKILKYQESIANLEKFIDLTTKAGVAPSPVAAVSSIGGASNVGPFHNPPATGAGTATAARASAAQQEIERLQQQASAVGLVNEALDVHNALMRAKTTLDTQDGQQIAELIHQIDAAKTAQQQQNQEIAEATRIHQEVETPMQRYNEVLGEANKLLADGRLSREDYDAWLKKLKDDLDSASTSQSKLTETGKKLSESNDRVGLSFVQDIARARTWQDVLTAAVDAVIRKLEQMDSLGGKSGGWLDSLFNAGLSLLGIGGTNGTGGIAVAGALAGSGGVGAGLGHYASGFDGVVGGRGGIDSTLVQFMGTPGERIKIGAAAEGGGGHTFVYSPTIHVRGEDSGGFGRSLNQHLAIGYAQLKRMAQRDGRR